MRNDLTIQSSFYMEINRGPPNYSELNNIIEINDLLNKFSKMESIYTSEKDWLEKAVKCYSEKIAFKFIDNTNLGITESDLRSALSLMKVASSKGQQTWKCIVGVLVGLGITSLGVYLIRLAILDPEPTTKLGLLVAGGLVLTLTGALGTLASLGVRFTVSVKSDKGGFEIKPALI